MISKNTISKVARTIATLEIEKQCDLIEKLAKEEFQGQLKKLDIKIENSLRIAFKGQRISDARATIILDIFCKELRSTSK